jgi:protein-L-isoaspartate(D-aspartate) O-methyltransferase
MGYHLMHHSQFTFALTVTAAALAMSGVLSFAERVSAEDRFERLRIQMVEQAISGEGISNPAVLSAMKKVPRHEFVGAAQRPYAYEDRALPIGAQQTISPPFVVAYMTEVLDPRPADKVLEIGTGSGYQAAVLSEISAEVYTIEIVPELARAAERRLKQLKYRNIFVREGDGYLGWPENAPFDRIIVTCSPEDIPRPLIEQLKDGGRMIIPVGERYQQTFHLLRKKDGQLLEEKLQSTLFVPMTGESESQRQILPDPLHPQIRNGSFEDDENGDDRADGWHYQRQASVCTENPMDGMNCLRFENQTPGQLSQALQGTAIDGQKIKTLQFSCAVRLTEIRPGAEEHEQAGLIVHFYDKNRKEINTTIIEHFRGTNNWQRLKRSVPVPPQSREMILRIGLNGAVGIFDLDDLQIRFEAR